MSRQLSSLTQNPEQTYFSWYRTDKGYRWDLDSKICSREDNPEKGLLLREIDESSPLIWYYPLEDAPDLFQEFAAVELNEQAVCQFANKYGLLLVENDEIWVIPDMFDSAKVTERRDPLPSNSFAFWKKELSDIKYLTMVWGWLLALERSETSANKIEEARDHLKLVIRWRTTHENETHSYPIDYALGPLDALKTFDPANPDPGVQFGRMEAYILNSGLIRQIRIRDVILPAQILVQQKINAKLKQYPIGPQIIFNDENRPVRYYVPSSLLAAMWWQFLGAFTGKRKFTICEHCLQPLDITETHKDKSMHDRCSAQDRNKRLKERKETALKLSQEGKSIEDIARELDSKPATVAGWIKKLGG